MSSSKKQALFPYNLGHFFILNFFTFIVLNLNVTGKINIDSTEEYEKCINLQASFSVIITELPS